MFERGAPRRQRSCRGKSVPQGECFCAASACLGSPRGSCNLCKYLHGWTVTAAIACSCPREEIPVRYTRGTRRTRPTEALVFQKERLLGAVGIEPMTKHFKGSPLLISQSSPSGRVLDLSSFSAAPFLGHGFGIIPAPGSFPASAFLVPPSTSFGSLPECSRSPWEHYPLRP